MQQYIKFFFISYLYEIKILIYFCILLDFFFCELYYDERIHEYPGYVHNSL